ncbi:heterokaryon incompatibility protein-domain-containing protein [Paraphoma chrysanthemicola]|nr:heterokaryon incompatibility protein-domain-containing protein [Paraphoma chrysanthemicola]
MDADTLAGQGLQLTPELFHAAGNIASQMAAISVSAVTCELHEHCDGSCSGNGPVEFQPLQIGNNPYRATAKGRPVYDLPLTQDDPTSIPSEDFQYTPIDSASGEIRVMRLHKAVFRSDAVVADLITINIRNADHPNFGALSYHWGRPEFDHAIVCNGKRLRVNASLHACLKRHRCDGIEKPELLWVDAICINQTDTKELNQQLPLMGDIYPGALTVFVDFGDVVKEWYVAYDLMCRVRVIRSMLNERVEDLVGEGLQERFGLPPFSHASWHNFGVIFTSPWLQRTWTIQEVVLAKDIQCRYGRFNFPWDAMISMSHLMGMQSQHFMSNLLYHQMIGQANLDRILRIRLEFQARRLRPLQLLWRTRDCGVSNPRDKVVGLLGMLVPTLTRDKFEPDYTWPTEELFYHFAKYVLRNFHFSDRAALLSFAGLSRRRKPQQDTPEVNTTLPSWVPDWLAHDSTSAAVFSIIREKPFNASKGTLPVMYALGEYGTDECFITQTGFSLGKIASLSKTKEALRTGDSGGAPIESAQAASEPPTVQNTNSAALRGTEVRWLQWHNDAAQVFEGAMSEQKLGRYEDPRSAFAITLLAGDDYKGDNATATTDPIEDPALSLAAVVADISSLNPRLTFVTTGSDGLYKAQALVACRDRRIAITEQGYIGLVPDCSEVGDDVYLLGGVTVPLVLRQKNEHKFVLVGDSYIHGVMEGEVAETLSADEWTPTFIY